MRLVDLHWARRAWLPIALMLGACGGGGSDESSSAATASVARPVEQTDSQIAAQLYDGSTRTPAGFYTETAASPSHALVATKHLKNTDVDPDLAQSAAQFELCTDDWNEALNWSELSAQHAAHYSNLVATNDDPRYFEFGRMQSGTPELYVQARVYKCAYLNRASADLRNASGAAGRLNVRPLSADELRELAEYFWQFTTYNNFGNVVLKSSGSSNATTLEHTLHIASLVRGGLSAQCDRVEVIAWRHRMDTTTGNLVLEVQPLWSFGARESLATAQLCAQ